MIFTLSCSAIPPNARVAGFRGSEKISQPYQFDVYFSVDLDPMLPLDIDLADAVYAKATLTIHLGNEPAFSYSGILSTVRLVRATETAVLFHARLVPQVWQLTLTKHSRIWTKKSIVDVINAVLDEAGIDHELRLTASYPTEEMIAQYKESNLAFLSRWMEREGMYFFFDQSSGSDVLVITDDKSAHTSLRQNPVKYFPQNQSDPAMKQSFDNFAASHNALPASVRIIDYDYARPLLDVSSSVDVEANAVGEIAEYGGRFFSPEDAARLARVRAEDHLAKKTVFNATGAATELEAGFKFTLESHPLVQYNTDYLLVSIEHYGFDSQYGPAWGSLIEKKYDDIYRVELAAIQAEIQYRTGIVTPWPRINGYENAIVDGPAQSQYAQIDDQGRYSVKFKFDEGSNKDGKASTAVRMAQPHGGSQEGFHFPLRKGVEVICSFLDGDPDRPVIVGVVHNMLNQSVVTQNNYTQNIIRSGSLNHIVIEDQSSQMWIEMYCPIFASTLFLGYGEWNFHLTTGGSGRIHTEINLQIDVNNEFEIDVVNDVTWSFHNHLDWTVDNNVTIQFNAELDWTVVARVGIEFQATLDLHVIAAAVVLFDATFDVTVQGTATFVFAANVDVTIAGNLSVQIGGNETWKLGGNRTRQVGGNEDLTVGGNRTRNVGGDEIVNIGGNQTITLGGKQTVNNGGIWSWFKWADSLQVTAGATVEAFLGAKASFSVGAFLEASLSAKVSMTLGAQLELFAGLRMSLIGALQLGISATNFSLTGINMGINLVDIKVPSAVEIDLGGPEIHIKVIELHL
ncbi:MAG: type VI secretion system tip protein TssI/VgrG [Polyangiaceae bacterium]